MSRLPVVAIASWIILEGTIGLLGESRISLWGFALAILVIISTPR